MSWLLLIAAIVLGVVAWNIYRRDKIVPPAANATPVSAYPYAEPVETAFISEDIAPVADAYTAPDVDGWISRAINYLVVQNLADNLTAQYALQTYLNGESLTWSQKQLVDAAISGVGMPPIIPTVGQLPDAPTVPVPPSTTVQQTPATRAAQGDTAVLRIGDVSPRVKTLKAAMNRVFPAYRNAVSVKRGEYLDNTDVFDEQLGAWIMEFQRRHPDQWLRPAPVISPWAEEMLGTYGVRF